MKRRTYVLRDNSLNEIMDNIPFFFRSTVIERALQFYFDNSEQGSSLYNFLKGDPVVQKDKETENARTAVKEEKSLVVSDDSPSKADSSELLKTDTYKTVDNGKRDVPDNKSKAVKNILGNFE